MSQWVNFESQLHVSWTCWERVNSVSHVVVLQAEKRSHSRLVCVKSSAALFFHSSLLTPIMFCFFLHIQKAIFSSGIPWSLVRLTAWYSTTKPWWKVQTLESNVWQPYKKDLAENKKKPFAMQKVNTFNGNKNLTDLHNPFTILLSWQTALQSHSVQGRCQQLSSLEDKAFYFCLK